MDKKQIKKIIATTAIIGSIIGGAFVIDKSQEKPKRETLTYNEYIQIIEKFNLEIQKSKDKGEKFNLKNIDKDNSIIKRFKEKINN